MLAGRPGDGGERVEGAGGRGAQRDADERGLRTRGEVLFDEAGEGVGIGGAGLRVDRDQPEVVAAEPRDPHCLEKRGMRLLGAVGGERGADPDPVRLEAGGPLPGREQRGQRGGGGGVLDDAPARAVGTKALRQADEVGHPVEDVGFELGAGRARGPEHPLDAEPG